MTEATTMPKARVGIYLDEDVFEVLQGLADRETRSVSNLVSHLIIQALRDRGLVKAPEISPLELSNTGSEDKQDD